MPAFGGRAPRPAPTRPRPPGAASSPPGPRSHPRCRGTSRACASCRARRRRWPSSTSAASWRRKPRASASGGACGLGVL